MPPPYPTPENITGFADLVLWSNTVTNNYYGELTFWIFFVVFFITFKKTDNIKAFAGASFLASLVGIFLFTLGILSLQSVIISIILLGFAILILAFKRPD